MTDRLNTIPPHKVQAPSVGVHKNARRWPRITIFAVRRCAEAGFSTAATAANLNLTIGTVSGISRRHKIRFHAIHCGETCNLAKLKAIDVHRIRFRRRAGALIKVLAHEYGVHRSTISDIVNGKAWKQLG